MRARTIEAATSGVLAAVYFALAARPLLFWTIDGLTTALSLSIGPGIAVLWFVGEVVTLLAPFVAIRLWAARSGHSGLAATLGALAAFWLPVVLTAVSSIAFGVPTGAYGGIGGAVASWVALAADTLATAIAVGLVIVPGLKGGYPRTPAAAH